MSEAANHKQTDEEVPGWDVSDEALEAAAGTERDVTKGSLFYTFALNLCCS